MTGETIDAVGLLQRLAPSSLPETRIETGAQGVVIELREPRLRFVHSFVYGTIAKRVNQSSQLLLKACNNKQRNLHRVLDLTAGWGVDALLLARYGQQVTMLERHQLLHAIIAHSIEQLALNPAGASIAQRMTLHQANARDFLQQGGDADSFDCIYLDPMFAAHKSGAKPTKDMQILQVLTENQDIESSFELALSRARKRVVVKRAAKAPTLTDLKPDLVQRAKTIRFDIYLTG